MRVLMLREGFYLHAKTAIVLSPGKTEIVELLPTLYEL